MAELVMREGYLDSKNSACVEDGVAGKGFRTAVKRNATGVYIAGTGIQLNFNYYRGLKGMEVE